MPEESMIKGYIIDMDGTLLDSMHIWNELGSRFLELKGLWNLLLTVLTIIKNCAY